MDDISILFDLSATLEISKAVLPIGAAPQHSSTYSPDLNLKFHSFVRISGALPDTLF